MNVQIALATIFEKESIQSVTLFMVTLSFPQKAQPRPQPRLQPLPQLLHLCHLNTDTACTVLSLRQWKQAEDLHRNMKRKSSTEDRKARLGQ